MLDARISNVASRWAKGPTAAIPCELRAVASSEFKSDQFAEAKVHLVKGEDELTKCRLSCLMAGSAHDGSSSSSIAQPFNLLVLLALVSRVQSCTVLQMCIRPTLTALS